MSTTDPALPNKSPIATPQTMVQEVMRRGVWQEKAFHYDARAFRNRLTLSTLVATLVAAAIVVLQWRLPAAAVVPLPKGLGHMTIRRWATTLEIMGYGCLGALITAIPAMAAVPTVTSPFNFPLFQGLLKIVVGGLTGLVGVIVIGGNGVTVGGFVTLHALIGTAIIFGAGQQAVTQFLDKRAGTIIASAYR